MPLSIADVVAPTVMRSMTDVAPLPIVLDRTSVMTVDVPADEPPSAVNAATVTAEAPLKKSILNVESVGPKNQKWVSVEGKINVAELALL